MTSILEGAKLIKEGKLVAFPTETVYGLGADATNQLACLDIYKLKGRPAHNPLIIHVNNIEQAASYVKLNNMANKLSVLWPGPLTMVLPKIEGSKLADAVNAGLPTVAIRITAHPIARELIKKSGCPIAAPSANKSGFLSSTNYSHVYNNFTDQVAIIEDQESQSYGLESTIIDLSTITPTILRFGFITPDNMEELLGKKLAIASKLSAIKSPGMLLKHYSPQTKLRLNVQDLGPNEIGLNFGNSLLNSEYKLNLSKNGNLAEAASNLFDYLHKLDHYAQKNEIKYIAVAPIPNISIGLAINDRLYRAANE